MCEVRCNPEAGCVQPRISKARSADHSCLAPASPTLDNFVMPQSLARVVIHTVFSTKDRFPFLQNAASRSEVHAYLGGCAKTLGSLPIQIGGVEDHVHLLTTLPRTLAMSDFVKEVKRVSTNWNHERGAEWAKFRWQAGYGIFSVSESNVPQVVRYIEDQDKHHRTATFQEEFRALLRKHNLTWDEAYVWD